MPLTQCPECKKDVSSQATTCPHCGYPLTAAQDKTTPSGSITPPPIQPQGQMPPIASGTSSSPKKKMSKAKLGCLVFLALIVLLILLGIIGALMGGSPEDSIPKNVVITSGQVVFGSWSDLDEFHSAALQIASADADAFQKAHPDGGTDADTKAFTEQDQRNLETLKAKYVADNRILNVPVGTKIEIVKFYDKTGNEITPVWNEPQKKVYTSDGNTVYPSGEWNGKTIYILLMFDSNPPGPW